MIKIRVYVYFPLAGFAATYLRFFPKIKKNYDYGVVIFLLTFNLITVSSFRQEDVVPLARYRLCTIAIGCAICLFMSLLVLPNWSGEDLNNCTVRKFEGLAKSIEGAYLPLPSILELITMIETPPYQIESGCSLRG
jgi:hypothetical protein